MAQSAVRSPFGLRNLASLPAVLAVAVLLLLLLLPGLVQAASVDLKQGWEYRWGDSPFGADGVPLWTLESDSRAWKAIDFPSNPPDREGRENVWYRVTLPAGEWRDPVLYIYSVDLIVEVYLDGRRIYRFGRFDAQGRGQFAGWPWHMITLPAESAGKTLYFRIYSNYYDIGLWGEIRLMERMELIGDILQRSASELAAGSFSLCLALLSLLFALLQAQRRLFLAIALHALASAGMAIGNSQARLLLLNQPLLWEYLAAGSYFLVPVAMAMLLEQWLSGALGRLFRAVWRFYLLYLVGALVLSLTGLVALSDTYPVFDLLFVVSLPLLLVPAWRYRKRANTEQRAILAANALLTLLLLISMAVAHGVLPWSRVPVSWGAFAFTLAIVAISLRHYIRTQRALQTLNASLEAKVRARTAELETLASRESGRARALEFCSRKNGILEELVTALQGCRRLQDAHRLLGAGLADLCRPIRGCFYLCDDASAGYRLTDCWGYPDAERPAARIASERELHEADRRYWCFPLAFEHPRLGRRPLGLLALQVGDAEPAIDAEFSHGTLHSLLERGVDRINLALSMLSLQEELERFSYEDALTGLKNRRFLDELLTREIMIAQRQQTPLSVILCDIDHFKRFNDTHGHAAGDEALRVVARQLGGLFRQTDIACRYGGEEFVIVMPAAGLEACRQRAEALRRAVAAAPFHFERRALGPITLSAGVACWPDSVGDPHQLLVSADKALYLAKQRGRDRVECGA
ncbi:GGDEF domain-containing protein [Azotobacter salinestris]|uniref:GGDEF domain-containing protein n=1 Tax=Azotobacter salinestris TaxID=69964 RepID=UPI0032DFA82B